MEKKKKKRKQTMRMVMEEIKYYNDIKMLMTFEWEMKNRWHHIFNFLSSIVNRMKQILQNSCVFLIKYTEEDHVNLGRKKTLFDG